MKVLCKFSCRYQVTVGSCACTAVVAMSGGNEVSHRENKFLKFSH